MKGNLILMLQAAQANNYAIPAFSFDNLEMLQAIVAGAEKQQAPIIIMITPATLATTRLDYLLAIANVAINSAKVPIVLHFDEGNDSHFIKTHVTPAFSSVMINYTNQSLKDNIEKSREMMQWAAPLGINMETKLIYNDNKTVNSNFDVEFVNETIILQNKSNINALALFFNQKSPQVPPINIALIKTIASKLPQILLTLVTSSQLSNEQLAAAIAAGITKVNFDDQLKSAFLTSLTKHLTNPFPPPENDNVKTNNYC